MNYYIFKPQLKFNTRRESKITLTNSHSCALTNSQFQCRYHSNGFGGELVAHGMRSIARTAAEESGKFRIEVLEAALAHSKKDEIVPAYTRADYLTTRCTYAVM